MTSAPCRSFGRQIEAFVDGELSGAARFRLQQHLDTCTACAAEVESVAGVGRLLRQAVSDQPMRPRAELSGLAGGVVSRIAAEHAQSWRGLLARVRNDWRWMLLAASGSLTGALGSAIVVSRLMLLAPAPASLADLMNNLGSSAGTLLVLATPPGDDRASMLMQIEARDGSDASFEATSAMIPSAFGVASEQDLARALSATVTRDGRLIELRSMPERDRLNAEALLADLRRLRDPLRIAPGAMTVQRMLLITNTIVSAKAL